MRRGREMGERRRAERKRGKRGGEKGESAMKATLVCGEGNCRMVPRSVGRGRELIVKLEEW